MQKREAIGINGSMLDEQPTGVGVYSFNVINQLSTLYANEGGELITVFSPTHTFLSRQLRIKKLSGFMQSSRYGKRAALLRFLWNTFAYPIQAKKFDLLLSPTTHGSFLLRNQVITIHDLLSLRFENISFHQRIYFKYLLPFLVSRAKVVVAVSETTKKDIITYLNCPAEKIQVIYNGYDEHSYFVDDTAKPVMKDLYGVSNYLLAIGATYPHKNFETLIHAYADLDDELKQQYPLVIAGGKRPYLQQLKLVVKKLNVEHYVHFLGYVPAEVMPALYREAFAMIFPSLYEGFGIPLLESMACGCPVIASDTSSTPEVCGDAALYFDPTNKDALTLTIEKLITNDSLYQDHRKKGLQRVQQFSWRKTAETLKALIDSHLENSKTPVT